MFKKILRFFRKSPEFKRIKAILESIPFKFWRVIEYNKKYEYQNFHIETCDDYNELGQKLVYFIFSYQTNSKDWLDIKLTRREEKALLRIFDKKRRDFWKNKLSEELNNREKENAENTEWFLDETSEYGK